MKVFTKCLGMAALTLGMASAAQGQVIFSEDFSGGTFPAGWARYNVDGNTPDPNVPQFTDAWIVAADFDNAADFVAMSTSWYSPPGSADDWLVTPSITLTTDNVLIWEAEAQDASFPDGYEVYISTVGNQVADFTGANGQMIFSIAAENGGAFVSRNVDVSLLGYQNQNVFFAWRNNSTDQFVLMLDSIRVEENIAFDAALEPNLPQYTRVPIGHQFIIGDSAVIRNVGSDTITNITLTTNIFDSNNVLVNSETSNPWPFLQPGFANNFYPNGYIHNMVDTLTIQYQATMTEADGDLSNNTFITQIIITDSTYARDDAVVAGSLGIGAGNGGWLGNAYTPLVNDTMTSVSVFMTNAGGYMAGQPLTVEIWDMLNGTPNQVVATTQTVTLTAQENALWTLPIPNGLITTGGTEYAVTVVEPDSTLSVGYTNNNFFTGATWIDWPTNPTGDWANNEDFGFNVVYIIRPNYGIPSGCDGSLMANATGTDETVVNGNDGTAVSNPTGGTSPYTYMWAPGGETTSSINNLSPGTYYVTVTDVDGCAAIDSVIINAAMCDSLFMVSVTGTDETTVGANDGTATATVTGGMAPYTYSWAPSGGSAATATNLAPGTYTVTVTDAMGCVTTGTVVINPAGCDPNYAVTATGTDETTVGANDGTATATVTGGTAPFSYNWMPGNLTTQTITNLAPGTYTVTVTDALGCVEIATVTIDPAPDAINDLESGMRVNAFPNPVQDVLNLTIDMDNSSNVEVMITNVLGAEVARINAGTVTTWNKTINTEAWAPGIYQIAVRNNKGTAVYQIVKE